MIRFFDLLQTFCYFTLCTMMLILVDSQLTFSYPLPEFFNSFAKMLRERGIFMDCRKDPDQLLPTPIMRKDYGAMTG